MELVKGADVFLVHGLKAAEQHDSIYVFTREVETVINDQHFSVEGGAIYDINGSAYFDEGEAYIRALRVQTDRLINRSHEGGGHIQAWNELLEVVAGQRPMEPRWSTEHFAFWEFLCPDCKRGHMDRRFIMRLELSRRIAGIPFVPGSGWRCERRNRAVGGVPDSSHLRGYAADIIATTSHEKFIIIRSLILAGFTRIGVARYYVHVDRDPSKAQEILYRYK